MALAGPERIVRLLRSLGRNDRLPMRLRLAALTRIVSHRTIRPTPFEMRLLDSGCLYRGRLDDWMDWNAYFLGGYKRGVLRLFQTAVDAAAPAGEGIAVDVGASVGQMAMSASLAAARVVAIEPSPRIAAICREHVALNRLSERITVIEAALSDANGTAIFFQGADNKGTGTLRDDFNGDPRRAVDVQVWRGDDLLASLDIPRVDAMKVDCQGMEAQATEGCTQTIARDKPIIIYSLPAFVYRNARDLSRIRGVLGADYRYFLLRNQFDPKVRIDPFVDPGRYRGSVIFVAAVPEDRLCALRRALETLRKPHQIQACARSGAPNCEPPP